MAKRDTVPPGPAPTRQSKITAKPVTIRLCDLDHKTGRDTYCHRDPAIFAYKDEETNAAKQMVDALTIEGQETPVEYYIDLETKANIQIKGFRRTHACWTAIDLRIDPALFHREMELTAVEVFSPNPIDYLTRSIEDNTVRKDLTDEEKIVAAGKLLERGVPSNRAAKALDLTSTQFRRYQYRLGSQIMRDHIAAEHITATDCDVLLQEAHSHNRVESLERDFTNTVDKIESYISGLRAYAASRQDKWDKKLSRVSKYIKPINIKVWRACLEEGTSMDWEPEATTSGWTYECYYNIKEGKIKISGLSIDAHKLSYEEFRQLAAKIDVLSKSLTAQFLKLTAIQAIKDRPTGEEDLGVLDFYKRHKALDLAKSVEERVAAARGEPDPDHGAVSPRVEKAIAGMIEISPEPGAQQSNGPEPSEPPTPSSIRKKRIS